MKKGFTLIEIIISITLILLIGTSATIFVVKNKSNNTLESITKQVLEAANLYINTEVDENGNNYKTGILSGGKGVQLSVQNLVDKGYIEESIATTLEDKAKENASNLYVLAALNVYENNEELCGEGLINFTPKWNIDSDEPIYLCEYDTSVAGGNSEEQEFKKSLFYKLVSDYAVREFTLEDYNEYNKGGVVQSLFEGSCTIDYWPTPNYKYYDFKFSYSSLPESETPESTTQTSSIIASDNDTPEVHCYSDSFDCYYINPSARNFVKIQTKDDYSILFRISSFYQDSSGEKILLVSENSITGTASNIDELKEEMYAWFQSKIIGEEIDFDSQNATNVLETENGNKTMFYLPEFLTSYDMTRQSVTKCSSDVCVNGHSFLISGDDSVFWDNTEKLAKKFIIENPGSTGYSLVGNSGIFIEEGFINKYRPVIPVDITDIKWDGVGIGTNDNPYIIKLSDLLNENA